MELRNQAHANPLLQELARAEADYMELMNKVNRAMLQELYPSEKT
jgi:exonuclease V gamma subunit